ncbi:MAG: sigma-70 family RNA polymerase sigma factor [Rhodocyclaceae bacterium]|nr:sigma-70 family RNA polymerase sigma factor [Rhodocyclaceae bacterium]
MLLVARGFVREPATELFRRHNRGLFNYLAWLSGGDRREAEDIAQATWVRVMSRCGDYQPQAAFRTFLFQIARNAWLDARGSAWHARRAELPDDLPEAETELSPEAELALRQDLSRLHGVLLGLPHLQREVVVLRFFAEMSLDEIGATVGTGYETVKSRLRYAYQGLRAALEASP